MRNYPIKPAYGMTAILMVLFFVVSGWATETLLCGFEQTGRNFQDRTDEPVFRENRGGKIYFQ